MRQEEVKAGETYVVKVGGALVPVRVDGERDRSVVASKRRRFYGQNLVTGREVHFTAARLRQKLTVEQIESMWHIKQ